MLTISSEGISLSLLSSQKYFSIDKTDIYFETLSIISLSFKQVKTEKISGGGEANIEKNLLFS